MNNGLNIIYLAIVLYCSTYVEFFYFGGLYMVSFQPFVSRTPAALPCAPVAHSSEVGSSCVKGFPCSFFSCLAAGADFSFLSERSDTTDEFLFFNKTK